MKTSFPLIKRKKGTSKKFHWSLRCENIKGTMGGHRLSHMILKREFCFLFSFFDKITEFQDFPKF